MASKTPPKMEYTRLGNSGLKISKVIYGTMSLGSSDWQEWVLNEEASLPLLKHAYDVGINTVCIFQDYVSPSYTTSSGAFPLLGCPVGLMSNHAIELTIRHRLVQILPSSIELMANSEASTVGYCRRLLERKVRRNSWKGS